MPRGRMLKTKVKEAKALATANLEADMKFRSKHAAEYAKIQLTERLADPDFLLKLASIAAVTLIIHNGIKWGEQVVQDVNRWGWIAAPFLGLFATYFGWTGPDTSKPVPDDLATWVISLGVAVLIVENFGEIMRALGGAAQGILVLAQTLLAAGA